MGHNKNKKEIKNFYLVAFIVASFFVCGEFKAVYAQQAVPTSASSVAPFNTEFNTQQQSQLGDALSQQKITATEQSNQSQQTAPDMATTVIGSEGEQNVTPSSPVVPVQNIGQQESTTNAPVVQTSEQPTDKTTQATPEAAPRRPRNLVVLPETNWRVREIPRKGDDGVGYCSLSKNFKSGQTLFLSRDASMSNTIAIDFQNDIMEVGRQYVVILRSGDLMKRITSIAATPKVIIMRTGTGNEIYDEFVKNRKASFRVGVDNLEFIFSADIIDALNKLTDCAEAVKAGRAFRGEEIEVRTDVRDTEGELSGTAVNQRQTQRTPPSIQTRPITETRAVAVDNQRMSPKRDDVAEISNRLVNKQGVRAHLQKKEAPKLQLLKSPEEIISQPSSQEFEELREATAKSEEQRKKQFAQLAKTIQSLKSENQKLNEEKNRIMKELENQKVQTLSSQEAVKKTRQELLSEINELRQTQRMLAMQDAEIQKSSQNILLDTQHKQMEIISQIKKLKEENEKLRLSAGKDRDSSMRMIAKNQVEMDRLREENLRLALQQELEEEVRKKKEINSEMENNRIRSELLRLQSENTRLAMDLEVGKSDIVWQTKQIQQQQHDIARAAQIEWESTKDFAVTAYDTQQRLIEETEKLKFENQRLKDLTLQEKEETRRLAEESVRRQEEINEEIERIKRQNEEMMSRLKQVREQATVASQVQEGYMSPTSLVRGDESYLGLPRAVTDNLKKWLYVSGAAGSSYVEADERVSGGEKIYRWQDKGVFGTAREIPDISSSSINKVVSDYIDRMQKNCKGDFARTSGNVQFISPYEVLEAETACMGRKDSSAAVILFVLGRDKINIITQETAPGNINVAIGNRDRIIGAIR